MSWRQKIQNIWFGEGSGAAEEIPATGPDRFWFIIKTHYLELIGLNILVLVLCLPVVTIPAALSGITNILMKWVHDEPVFFWQDFFSEFKARFGKRLLAGLLLIMTPLSLSLYAVMFGYKNLGLVLLVLIGLVSIVFQGYLFPIFVIVDIPVGTAVKDAILTAFLEWQCSLRILLLAGILIALCLIFTLYVIPIVVICLISLYQLTICLWVNEPINKRLILLK